MSNKQYRMSRAEREALERMQAEDHLLRYLNRFPTREQQAAVAIRVEMFLAAKWANEQQAHWLYVGHGFVCIQDSEDRDREFKLMTPDDLNEIKQLYAETAPGASHTAAEQYVLDILSKFHTDRAWFIAHLMRSYLVAERSGERRRNGGTTAQASLHSFTAPTPGTVVGHKRNSRRETVSSFAHETFQRSAS